MIQMEPIPPAQPPTKLEFLEYLTEYHKKYFPNFVAELDILELPYYNEWFERYQSEEIRKSFFEDYFNDDWRSGQEVHKLVITQRLYQTSPNSTQA